MQLLSTVIAATKQSRIPTIFVLLCHTILIFYGLKHTCSQLSLIMQDTTTSTPFSQAGWGMPYMKPNK
jgi:hypothetical protein